MDNGKGFDMTNIEKRKWICKYAKRADEMGATSVFRLLL